MRHIKSLWSKRRRRYKEVERASYADYIGWLIWGSFIRSGLWFGNIWMREKDEWSKNTGIWEIRKENSYKLSGFLIDAVTSSPTGPLICIRLAK